MKAVSRWQGGYGDQVTRDSVYNTVNMTLRLHGARSNPTLFTLDRASFIPLKDADTTGMAVPRRPAGVPNE